MRRLVTQLLAVLGLRSPEDDSAAHRVFFAENPLPMWIFDAETLRFLDVNAAAVGHYGYSRAEFLRMTIKDIRPPEDVAALLVGLRESAPRSRRRFPLVRHVRKSGEVLFVEIASHPIRYLGRDAQLVLVHDLTERRRAEEALRDSEEQRRALMDAIPALIGLMDPDGRYVYVNRAYEELLGVPREEIVGRTVAGVFGQAVQESVAPTLARARAGERVEVAVEVNVPGRGTRTMLVTYVPRVASDGSVAGIVSLANDVTDRLRLEEQVRQSQKMEAVGQLAGGVAHDFNNLLTVITSTTGLALEDPTLSPETRADLEEVRRAASRAADLTRQLLALGRKQTLQPREVDVNEAVLDAAKMLRRLIREDVVLETELAEDAGHVLADPGQLEIALLNLVVNARDAMPGGGRITIATTALAAGAALARDVAELAPGPHVAISVRDTGAGMSREVLERATEPFFTTKPLGQGTGLGLATVYGIARQSGGALRLASAPGAGTTATLYLPIAALADEAPALPGPDLAAAARGGTVLVAEDEAAVRSVVERVLSAAGYTVLSAASGEEAISAMRERGGAVDLVVSDVIMPGMGGPELAARLRAKWPSVRILFTSGYSADEFGESRTPDVPLLPKPFAPEALLAAVAAAIRGS